MKKLLGVLSCIVLFCTCKNDLELLTDYKETAIIYGILNQDTAVKAQYIRVNKAFLGPGNALDMAKVYDSSSFKTGSLDVKIERWKNGVFNASYTLKPDSSILKDPGIFSSPKQVLYKMTNPLFDDSEYRLTVTSKSSGNVYSAKTTLVKGGKMTVPSSNASQLDVVKASVYKVKWQTSNNGRLYQTVLRFHYKELMNGSNDTVNKYVDWFLAAQKSIGLTGGEEMEASFILNDFYQFLRGKILDNPDVVKRIAGKIDFLVTVAADDLNTFYEVNQPSTGIVQSNYAYSNITNGLGIFSARYTVGVYGINIKPGASIDTLKFGYRTKHLKFD